MAFRRLYFVIIALLLTVSAVPGLANVNPTLEWKTITTENFEVHYHEGTEWTAQQVARVAEEVRPYINDLYDTDPGLCHFVILDTDDYANGAAYFYDNKIEIWATNLEFGLRGTTRWLRNVVTHEYTHIVSIQAAMKMPKRIPAVYFQMVGFEEEKRPDVITGYPNVIVSYPYVGAVISPWWAEGTAQYQSPDRSYDCWDAHRDMIVRSAVLADNMLTYDEMGFLGHRSIGNEMVYDHGYGLVNYIALTYGPDALEKISVALGKFRRATIDGALKEVTGKTGPELYDDWRRYLRARYEKQLEPVYANPREGLVLNDEGYMTITPTYSPDGERIAFLSNRGSDFTATMLYVMKADGEDVELVAPASSRGSFSPDGRRFVYGRHVRIDKFGARVSDLYVHDFDTEKDTRLTKGARAAHPSFSPDGSRVVCVLNRDGTHRLAEVDPAGGEPRVIFASAKGTQLYAPQYSPDGTRILFGIFTESSRDIASVAADGSDFRYIIRTRNDERDASWGSGGSSILFSSDRTGIFNLYRLNFENYEVTQLTNVTGGAFTPQVSRADGTIAYSGYGGEGYNVSALDTRSTPVETMTLESYGARTATPYDECRELRTTAMAQPPAVDFAASSLASLGTGYSGVVPQGREDLPPGDGAAAATTDLAGLETVPADAPLESQDYKGKYSNWQFYPRVVVWDGVFRLGAFMASSEVLDKQTFFASGSYGTDGGFDALLSFEMRRLWPVIYIEYFRMRQKYKDQAVIDDLQYFLDIRYDLWSADLGLRFELDDSYSRLRRQNISIWYNHSEYSVFINPEFVDTDGTVRPDQEVGWKYFIGNEFYFRWDYAGIRRSLDSNINPRGGRTIRVELMYAIDDLFTSGEFEYGFNPSFETNRFGQYTIDWREYIPLPVGRHTLELRGFASAIDNVVDDFFWVFMGGMDRARGYTYYTLGGRAGALAGATWRFPIWRQINSQVSWLTFKDIYGAAFFEIANAWDDGGFPVQGYKRTAGYELRFNMGSFYAYPTAIGFTGAYGMDRIAFVNPLFENAEPIIHEPRWRYYFTMGFMF